MFFFRSLEKQICLVIGKRREFLRLFSKGCSILKENWGRKVEIWENKNVLLRRSSTWLSQHVLFILQRLVQLAFCLLVWLSFIKIAVAFSRSTLSGRFAHSYVFLFSLHSKMAVYTQVSRQFHGSTLLSNDLLCFFPS